MVKLGDKKGTKMNQTPDIKVGTVLSMGTVKSIHTDHVILNFKGQDIKASLTSARKTFEYDQVNSSK